MFKNQKDCTFLKCNTFRRVQLYIICLCFFWVDFVFEYNSIIIYMQSTCDVSFVTLTYIIIIVNFFACNSWVRRFLCTNFHWFIWIGEATFIVNVYILFNTQLRLFTHCPHRIETNTRCSLVGISSIRVLKLLSPL